MAETVPPPMSGIRSRPEIGEEEMVCTVQQHAVGRVKSREPFLIQDQTHGALRRDPVAPLLRHQRAELRPTGGVPHEDV
jgi:hypothetical protein